MCERLKLIFRNLEKKQRRDHSVEEIGRRTAPRPKPAGDFRIRHVVRGGNKSPKTVNRATLRPILRTILQKFIAEPGGFGFWWCFGGGGGGWGFVGGGVGGVLVGGGV